MSSYSRAAERAHKTLKKKGQQVILFKESPQPYTRSDGSVVVLTKKYRGYGVIFPVKGSDGEASMLLKPGDRSLLLSAKTTSGTAIPKPQEGDRLRDSSLNMYTVIQAIPLSPEGTVVYYDCVINGGN